VPDERLELIGGELVPMSQKGIHHEIVKQALSDRWCRLPRGVCDVAVATELSVSEDTFLGPDFVIFPRAGGFAGLAPATALLVVEIADSS
jgi:hypothetical protein